MAGQSRVRKTGLSQQKRNEIIKAEVERAEENLLRSTMALAMAEEVEDLIDTDSGEESTLKDKQKDVEGWQRVVNRLKKDYYPSSKSEDSSE